MQAPCKLHFKGSKRYIDIKKKRARHKESDTVALKQIQCFGLQYIFHPTCYALKTWFDLSRVKVYRNDLVQNYFELTGSSSYRGFESVTEGKITVNV